MIRGIIQRPLPRWSFVFAAAIAFWAVPQAPARVFTLRPGGGIAHADAQVLGWEVAYRTRLRLNQGGGGLELLNSPLGMSATLRQLEEAYAGEGGRVFLFEGRLLSWGLVAVEDRVIRLLAWHLDSGAYTLVLRLEQTREEFERSRTVPARHPLREVPAYPGSQPTLYVADEGTRLAMAFSTSGAPPADVAVYMESALLDAGWSPALPLAGLAPASHAFALYTRGRSVCGVAVKNAGQARGSVITLWHKAPGAKAGF